MAKKTNRLGRGLNTLIAARQGAATPPPGPNRSDSAGNQPAGIRDVPVDAIQPNPRQPRTVFDENSLQELAESIRSNGLIQPLVIRPLDDSSYELIAGERRLRAAKLAELETVPAIIRDVSDAESLELALIENLQREDLGPLERAAAYQQYLDTFGGSVEDLARRLAESRANISNYLRLLKLHPEVCFMLGSGELGMGQARAIASIIDPQRQLATARLAVRRNLSVRQVEDIAKSANEGTEHASPPPEAEADPRRRHLEDVSKSLTKAIGMRVRLYPGRRKNSGRVVVTYNNLDEFDKIAELLGSKRHLED